MALPGIQIGTGITIGGGIFMGTGSPLLTTSSAQNYNANGAAGYFFRVYGPLHNNPPNANYDQIQAGWTCVQLPGSSVVSVVPDSGDNNESCTVNITGGTFVLNSFYSFQGYA